MSTGSIRAGLVVIALAIGLLATQVGTVSAKAPVETTFTLSPTEIELGVNVLPSGVMRFELVAAFVVSGDWEGEWEHSAFATLSPTGTWFAFAFGTFTGTILGEQGTVELRLETHGSWPDVSDIGTFELRFSRLTILGGTGELAGAHGQGVEEQFGMWRVWVVFGS